MCSSTIISYATIGYKYSFVHEQVKKVTFILWIENVIILSPNDPTLRADHAKTKDYCMTRFFGHGQSILQVFETPITLHMVESVKCHLLSTLLDPISWDLAISLIPCEWLQSEEIH